MRPVMCALLCLRHEPLSKLVWLQEIHGAAIGREGRLIQCVMGEFP